MKWLPEAAWARLLVISAYIVCGWFFVRWLGVILPVLAPFIISWLIAAALQRPTGTLSRTLHISRKIAGSILSAGVLILLGAAVFFAGKRLVAETGGFITFLGKNSGKIIASVENALNTLREKLPHLFARDGYAEGLMIKTVTESASSVIGRLSAGAADALGTVLSSIPQILIFAVEAVAATFYFCADYNRIRSFFSSLMPSKIRTGAFAIRKSAGAAIANYIKAAALLMLITLGEMFVGFLIIGVKYAFLTALLVSFVDFLPILGTGTVLAPWGIFCIFTGDTARGISLIALWGISEFIRSFIEPKLVSYSVGLHPAATLVSIYCGYRLFGVAGMIFCPIALTCAVGCYGFYTSKFARAAT